MTPLRQRMIDDMQLRNLAPATQRNYIHHVARFASYYGLSPEKLDLEDIRQFHLYLLNDRKYSPEAVNQSVSACRGAMSISHARAGRTNCPLCSARRKLFSSSITFPGCATAPP